MDETASEHRLSQFPVHPLLIAATSLIAIAVSIYCLSIGITIVFPHLFYIPIILAVLWYPRQGVAVAMVLSGLYLFLVGILTGFSSDALFPAVFRVVVFIGIALVVSHLAGKLKASEQRYQAIFDHTGSATIIVNNDMSISLANVEMMQLTCYLMEELVGMQLPVLFAGDDRELIISTHRLLRTHPAQATGNDTVRMIRKDGALRDVYMTWGMIPGTSRSVGSFLDITEKKQTDDALQKANVKLNILSSITRHDIRNKINVLMGYLDLMKTEVSDKQVLEYISKEEDAARAISRKIDLTKEYQDLGVREPQWQNVSDTFSLAVSQTDLGDIRIDVDLDGAEIFADPMLENVFVNLLDNSLVHGEGVGRIGISSTESEDGLIIVYADDGQGIPADEKDLIFQQGFGRHNGLGLFLVQVILAISGISIRETGVPGTGVRFEITIPPGGYRISPVK